MKDITITIGGVEYTDLDEARMVAAVIGAATAREVAEAIEAATSS